MSGNEASTLCDLRKLAAELGPAIKHCNDTGQLSCAVHLTAARNSLHAAIHNFKPGVDERQLQLQTESWQHAQPRQTASAKR